MRLFNTAKTYGEIINSLSILAYHKYLALVSPTNILLNIYIYIYIYIYIQKNSFQRSEIGKFPIKGVYTYVQVLGCPAKRREALQNTLLMNITRRSDDVI